MRTKIRDPRRAQREARQGRVRRRLETSQRPRLTVFRSAKHIYAQLEDGVTGRTLGGASTRSPALRGELARTGNVAAAKRVGRAIAEVARARGIERVVFTTGMTQIDLQCPAGKFILSGGCSTPTRVEKSHPLDSTTWRCAFEGNNVNNTAAAICARVRWLP